MASSAGESAFSFDLRLRAVRLFACGGIGLGNDRWSGLELWSFQWLVRDFRWVRGTRNPDRGRERIPKPKQAESEQ